MVKEILTLAAAISLSAATAKADNVSLYLEPNSGNTTSWTVESLQKMTFENGNVVLTLKSGATSSAAISTVKRLYFSTESSGVESIEADSSIAWDGGVISVQTQGAAPYTVCGVNGAVVARGTVSGEGKIDLNSAESGIYIVSISGKTFKILK